MIGGGLALVVHGHRDGNAVGGQLWISAECRERVRAAEEAACRHGVGHVLFSGSGAPGYPSEARQMAESWGPSPVHVSLDEASSDSAENVQAAYRWAEMIGASELLVVSSWWHLRLFLYYRRRERDAPTVRHVRTRRCNRVVAHLMHELRYLPRALRS